MMPMRARTSLRALALATLVTAALSSPVGSASATGGGSVGSRLSSARQQQAMAIAAVQAARQGLARARASAETDQRAATRREQALSSTISDLQSQLDAAVARAKEAGIRVHDLAQQLARIRAARAQQQARQQNLSGAV